MAKNQPAQPKRKRHRLRNLFVLMVLLLGVGVWFLPALLGSRVGRAWLVGRINAALAPGSVGLDGVKLSWTGPVELTGLTLVDPRKKRVIVARKIRTDWSLLGLITGRPNLGTITIDGAEVDLERRADGSIDLLDALGNLAKSPEVPAPVGGGPAPPPAAAPAPARTRLVVEVKNSKLRAVSPELAEPVAGLLEATLTLAPEQPMTVVATLADGPRSVEARAKLHGQTPGGGADDLDLAVVGKDWPLHLKGPGANGRCRLVGTLDVTRVKGLWAAKGDAALVQFEADGPALAGDHLAFDRVTLAADLGQSPEGWAIRKLAVICPVARLDAGGVYPLVDGTPTRLDAVVDLARLAKVAPNALRLKDGMAIEQGKATLRIDLAAKGGVERAELAATFADLVATEGGRRVDVLGLPTVTGSATRTAGKVSVQRFEVQGAGLDVRAGGDLDAGIKLQGTIELATLHQQLVRILDLGKVNFSGQARLAADYRKAGDHYKARLIADCKSLDLAGIRAEPIRRDLVRLDASALGPQAPDGLPTGWTSARLDLKAGDLVADLDATSALGDAKGLSVVANLGLDVATPAPGRFGAKGTLSWDGRVVEIADLRAGLVPSELASGPGAMALAVRGRFDLKTGELELKPIDGIAPGALGLAAEGLKATGLGQSALPLNIEGSFVGDLAAADRLMAAWSGSPSKGYAGSWAGRLNGSRDKAGLVQVDGRIGVANLFTPSSIGPVKLTVQGNYAPEADQVTLSTLDLTTGYGRLVADGILREPADHRWLDLKGKVEPRWDVINGIVAKSVEPGARVQATIRPFHVGGMLKADSTSQRLGQMFGEVGLDIDSAQAYGVTLGKAAVVLKMGAGQAKFDPIVTTVNGGTTLIRGRLALDDAMGLWLMLDPSRIDNAVINDAVSTKLLAFVAPVLNDATGVNGKVSVVLGDKGADIPLSAEGGQTRMDGVMAFQDVVCKPGPFAAEVLALTGRPDLKLAIAEPIALSVADGRVRQSGLSIPLGGGGAKLGLAGSVGFDKTVDAKATVPITASMLGRDPTLNKLVAGTNITIPIGGTLANPDIDRRALHSAIRDATKNMLERGVKDEAGRFLERVAGPTPGGAGPKANATRDSVRGLLEGLGKEIAPPKP